MRLYSSWYMMILASWVSLSRGHLCLHILNKVDISTGVTNDLLTHWQTLKNRATQLLIKYKSGALVTQYVHCSFQSVLNRLLRHGLAVPTIWLTAEIIWPLLVARWILSVSRFVHFLIDTRYASGVGYNHTWDLSRPAVAEIFSWCCNFL